MAFKRDLSFHPFADSALTAALVGIGMNFAAKSSMSPNIEDTLVSASIEGMDKDDFRVLAVLVTWLSVHHPWINVDRLFRIVKQIESIRVRGFWCAVGKWLNKDRRFLRLAKLYRGPRLDLLATGTEFQIKRKGEDSRFKNTPLRVPSGTLRDRKSDVLSPHRLATIHPTYRHRILMGPSYRADMWSALENDPSLSPSVLARQAHGSFATAWQVRSEFQLLHPEPDSG